MFDRNIGWVCVAVDKQSSPQNRLTVKKQDNGILLVENAYGKYLHLICCVVLLKVTRLWYTLASFLSHLPQTHNSDH